jgi:hypothetical protein
MTKTCRQKTRYVDGLLVASGAAFYFDRPVVYDTPITGIDQVQIDSLPDGAEIRIEANPALGTPELIRRLDSKATLGRKGRKGFAAAVADIPDPSQRGAYLAVALGGIQGKLENVGHYGEDVMRAIYVEAGIDTRGRDLSVDESFPGRHYGALSVIADSSAVDPALRRAAMAVLVNHPASGYIATADGAEEAYQADRMERDISRIQIETTLAAAALHDAWRAPRLQPDGTYEPRIKDVEVYDGSGTMSVDIANTAYADLPTQWQAENHAAATAVVHAIEANPTPDVEELADVVHQEWLSRNAEWAEPTQLLPYAELPEDEKQKDREVVLTALAARSAAAVEATRDWVTQEDMRFFDGIAGFKQTQDLAMVAFDTNLPQAVRQAASDRVLSSPYLTTGALETPLELTSVPVDDPVRVSVIDRVAELERLSNERLRRVSTPAPAARGAHLTRTEDSDTPTFRPGRLS